MKVKTSESELYSCVYWETIVWDCVLDLRGRNIFDAPVQEAKLKKRDDNWQRWGTGQGSISANGFLTAVQTEVLADIPLENRASEIEPEKNHLPTVMKIFGLSWTAQDDKFVFYYSLPANEFHYTKRAILKYCNFYMYSTCYFYCKFLDKLVNLPFTCTYCAPQQDSKTLVQTSCEAWSGDTHRIQQVFQQ